MALTAAADSPWSYTLAERDRRWNAVRRRAAEAGLDCVFVPKGNRIDARYLTLLMDACIIIPTDGRPPTIIEDRGRGTSWTHDADVRGPNRAVRGSFGAPMAEALLDLGMERGRIGVAGLGLGKVTHVRAVDGVLSYGSYAEVLRRLPNARFEDATDLVGFIRYVKSDEEIQHLRHASVISEAAIERMVRVARPGVDEAVLYAEVTDELMRWGSEHYQRARADSTATGWALTAGLLGQPDSRFTEPPIGRRLQSNSLITNEVSAIWGGMVAQEVQPILLGPIPEKLKPVIDAQREVWEAGLEFHEARHDFC